MALIDAFLNYPLLDHLAYWIIFFATILEASPIVGIFIPGLALAIIGGFLAKLGMVHLTAVLIIATVGGILGDMIGYYLGKKYGTQLMQRFPKYQEYYEKTEKLMNEHAGKTLVVGRFSTLTRAFGPLVAGATKIKFRRFLIYNIIGAIAWSFFYVFMGYIFGEGYQVASHYIGMFVTIALGIIVLVVFGYYLINRKKKIFSHSYIYFLLMNIFSVYIFAKFLQDVLAQEVLVTIDEKVHAFFAGFSSQILTACMKTITVLFDPIVLLVFSCLFILYFAWKNKWYQSLHWLLSMTSAAASVFIIKLLIQRSRPIPIPGDFSFPSAHAAINVLFFCLLFYSYKEKVHKRKTRVWIVTAITLFMCIIGFNRLYLQAHWISDVIAGYALGLFWFTLYILILKLVFYKKEMQ